MRKGSLSSQSAIRLCLVLLGITLAVGLFLKESQTVSSQKVSAQDRSTETDSRVLQELTKVTAPEASGYGMARVKVSRAQPQAGHLANFAESRPLSELAVEEAAKGGTLSSSVKEKKGVFRDRDANLPWNFWLPRDENEKNALNRQIIRKIDEKADGTPDAAIASVPGGPAGKGSQAPEAMPLPNVSFDGIGNPAGCAGCSPPDTNGEIGKTQFVQTVNTAVGVFNRTTGAPIIPVVQMGTLFATLPGPCANTDDGDPIVLYDQMADRWILSQFCWSPFGSTGPDHQIFAVSKTGDATGAYFLYDFVMPNIKFNDYPHFGVWTDGYYMTDNQFNQAGDTFLGAGVFAFDRTKMLAGDPTASFIYFDMATGCPAACINGGMLPADLDGFRMPPAGAPNSILQFDADEYGGGQTDSLRIFDFHADFAVPANSTLTQRTGSPLAVAAFDPREVPLNSRIVIPQPPPGVGLDMIGDRLMFRLSYRNMGGRESLALTHTVNAATNPAFRSGVRYYDLKKTTPGGAWSVNEQATMAGAVGDTENRWMGSTALNNNGSQAVGYSVSSATVSPSVRYAGRLPGDPAGSLGQGENSLVVGAGSQTSTGHRWGDYSDLTVDPTDDCTFWYTQEYYSATSSSNWATRVGSFTFGPCPAVPKGILNGTITSTAGGAAIPNASVTAGAFSRLSNGSGVYSIDPIEAPGIYTVIVSAPNYNSATVPNVSVALGGTTVQNVQLVPKNVLQSGAASITAESCAPANNAADPGETVTMNLPVVNNGGSGATTSNLVATLQATGGVSSPSGPQNYGAVAQGGPGVVKPFTFTVNATCGSPLTVTLQLQDGATNYGTITYNLGVGALGAAAPFTATSGNLTTPIDDNATVDIPINIAQTGAVADVNVKVRLNHTFDGDVSISLVSPDNTVVPLSLNHDTALGGGDNYGTGNNDCSGTPTIFDDAAAVGIATGTPPFAGTFKPDSPLSAMNGKTITGAWKLRVNDNASLDTGTVGCVTLDFQKQPYICCGVAGTPVIANGGAPAIIAESVSPANNATDPGEMVTVNFPLINTGDGNTTNLVATMQTTANVHPISSPSGYGVVTAGGPAVTKPYSFSLTGACGTTQTVTLALQDGAVSLGTLTYNFVLGTTSSATQTFSNATAIVIPGTGTGATTGAPATPYPSNITVSGIAPVTAVSKVTVTLKGVAHTFPSDVDVLLVGPTGRKFIVLSDAIGGTDWTGQDYTFDDGAAALMPSSGTPPVSGSFKPTDYGTGDVFPAPAPAAPYMDPSTAGTDTFASAFNGQDPNGTWSLYVVDDAGTDVGTFAGGWSLSITTAVPVCNTQACTLNVPANITQNMNTAGGAIVNYVIPACTGACGAITGSPASGSFFPVGDTLVTVTATNSTSAPAAAITKTFNVHVNAVTAANVSVAGRVTTADGAGLRNAVVSIRDQQGNTKMAITNAFGYFRFDAVEAGSNYLVSVTAKRYSFQSQLIQLTDNVTDLSFTPQ
jgi:subtilisin-like proprotein convertase family protein